VGLGVLVDRPRNIPGASVVVFLLPLILSMTVRSDRGGASLALLARLSSPSGRARTDEDRSRSCRAEGVQALQILLAMLTVPILCLAAVIVELHQARAPSASGSRRCTPARC